MAGATEACIALWAPFLVPHMICGTTLTASAIKGALHLGHLPGRHRSTGSGIASAWRTSCGYVYVTHAQWVTYEMCLHRWSCSQPMGTTSRRALCG
jgi:hypothetical protein